VKAEDESRRQAVEAQAKALRHANGQDDDDEEEEEEQLSHVQKWLLTAPSVESIERAGAEVSEECPRQEKNARSLAPSSLPLSLILFHE
jgi:hypothetical protein